MVGSKLKLARSAAGLSLRGLEDRIAGRVTAQAIGKYERSESVPSSGVLIALAEGLGVSVEYLTSNRGLALDAVEFRDKTILTKRDQVRVQAQAADLLERYLAVEELLALPTVDWDKPREAPYPVVDDLAAVDHGALSLRMHWDVGRNPISSMVELLEERGVKVLAFNLKALGGFTAFARRGRDRVVPVIVVNCEDSGERQRFTLARELGHLILAMDANANPETTAQRFAGAFLMAPDALRMEIGRRRTSIGWSELFSLKASLRRERTSTGGSVPGSRHHQRSVVQKALWGHVQAWLAASPVPGASADPARGADAVRTPLLPCYG